MASQTELNRAIVTDFIDLFYHQKNVPLAFANYVSDDYIQHNPNIPDGPEAAVAVLQPMFSNPKFMVDVKHVLVDGDMAVVHLHARSAPGDRGGAVVDMFRLREGKIVEHWDVLQAVPEHARNPHPMF